MQEIAYDALGEHVARRSVPVSEGTPESQLLFDLYQYDAMGREVLHTHAVERASRRRPTPACRCR